MVHMSMGWRAAVLCVVSLLLLACRPADHQNAEPSRTFVSGGIGLPRDEWEQIYSSERFDNTSSPRFRLSKQMTADVGFSKADGRVQRVVVVDAVFEGTHPGLSIEDMERFALTLLPSDSQPVSTERYVYPGRRLIAQVFSSSSLAAIERVECGANPTSPTPAPGTVSVVQDFAPGATTSRHVTIGWTCAK